MNTQPARHSVSVAGVITDDHDRTLLIQRRDNRHWEPPGGGLSSAKVSTTACAARSAKKPDSTSNQSP
jgi:8-oxo-dGTP diphosphatase